MKIDTRTCDGVLWTHLGGFLKNLYKGYGCLYVLHHERCCPGSLMPYTLLY